MPITNKDNKIEPKSALKNPLTSKPGAIKPANINKRAFIIKLKKPNVRMLIGSVINSKKGLMKVLIKAMIMHTNIALIKFSTFIPGISQEIKTIAKAYKIHLNIIFNI